MLFKYILNILHSALYQYMCNAFTFLSLKFSIERLMTSLSGWLAAIGLFVCNMVTSNPLVWVGVFTVICIDAVFGIGVSLKKGGFALSDLLKRTIMKISTYYTSLLILYIIENIISDNYMIAFKAGAAILLAIELFSIMASALIIYPNLPGIRALRGILKGEIERKISRPIEGLFKEDDNEIK